jgi:hypothetical protein
VASDQVHVACTYCGQNVLLPPELIALQHQRREEARQHAERQRATRRTVIGGALVLGAIVAIVSVIAIVGANMSRRVQTAVQRARDPKQNGLARIRSAIADRQRTQGCTAILAQPETRQGDVGTLNANVKPHSTCVVVMGATGIPGATVDLRLSSEHPLKLPPPEAAPFVEYRLCAEQAQKVDFALSSNEPFSFAAIDCPRTQAELERTSATDPRTSGLSVVRATMAKLLKSGCATLREPTVKSGLMSSTITSKGTAPCVNLIAAAHFPDTVLSADIEPRSANVAVSAPGQSVTAMICSGNSQEYSLRIDSNNSDFYTLAVAECPRFGAEGTAKLRKLQTGRAD